MAAFQPLHAAANLFIFHLILLLLMTTSNGQQLKLGFYSQRCPTVAEATVRSTVKQALQADNTTVARFLLLSFNDCFVEGCDGSILLETGAGGGERQAFGNAGLQGFGVIETAKQRLESLCPGFVSCADIVALTTRDAVALVGYSSTICFFFRL